MFPLAHALSIIVPAYGLWQAYQSTSDCWTPPTKGDPEHGVDALTGAIGTGIWWLTFTHYSGDPIFAALDAIELAAGTALVSMVSKALNAYCARDPVRRWSERGDRARPRRAGSRRELRAAHDRRRAQRVGTLGGEHPRRRLTRVRRRPDARRTSHQTCSVERPSYFAIAARLYAPVRLVGVIGDDFREEDVERLRARGNRPRRPRTPKRWLVPLLGRYDYAMNTAETINTDLGVFADWQPRVPESFAEQRVRVPREHRSRDPARDAAQRALAKAIALDTMNYWIDHKRDALLESCRTSTSSASTSPRPASSATR